MSRLFSSATAGAASLLARVSPWSQRSADAQPDDAEGAHAENAEEEQIAPRALAFGASAPRLEPASFRASHADGAAGAPDTSDSEGTAAEEEDAELAVAEEQSAPSAGAASASALVLGTSPQPPQQPRADAPTELLSVSNNTASDCACTICPPANRPVFSSRLRLQNHLNKLHEHASAAELAPMAMAPCCALGCGAFFSVLPNKPD